MRKHIFPLVNGHVKIRYNPFFIAMGTTMQDFLHPEMDPGRVGLQVVSVGRSLEC